MLKDVEDWYNIIFGMGDGILKGFLNIEYEWGFYNNFCIFEVFVYCFVMWF